MWAIFTTEGNGRNTAKPGSRLILPRIMTRLAICLFLVFTLLPTASGDDLALAPGRLLVAAESVGGEIFAKTVILLLHYDDAGAMGLVVNRPTDVRPQEVLEENDGIVFYDGALYWGGPVQMASLRALLRTDTPPEGAQHIVGSIHAVAVDDAFEVAASNPASVRIFIGYSGWGAGQLDYELARGSWHVLPASDAFVFAPDPKLLWHRLLPTSGFRATLH